MKTLTGIDLVEAFKRLDDVLPAGAYKAISGGKGGKLGLTDINPGYMPPLLLDLFGPCGYGWGYNLVSMSTEAKTVTRKAGYDDEEYYSSCQIEVWYRFQVEGGDIIKSDPIPARGGSNNTQQEWAEKGAITYALGTAWFLAGYQVAIYKGERSHTDFAGQQKRPPQSKAPSINRDAINERIRHALFSLGCKTAEQAATKVKRMTTFETDGKTVEGREDYKAISDKAAKVLAERLEREVKEEEKPM